MAAERDPEGERRGRGEDDGRMRAVLPLGSLFHWRDGSPPLQAVVYRMHSDNLITAVIISLYIGTEKKYRHTELDCVVVSLVGRAMHV
jgi:hypothetical protein